MATKIPVRGEYDIDDNVTGLSEFQTGDVIPVLHGGTGIDTLTPSSIVIGSNSNSMTQVLVADNQLLVGAVVNGVQTIKATSTIDCGRIGE